MATNAAVAPTAATEHSNETLLSELPNQEEGETCPYDPTLASVAPSAARGHTVEERAAAAAPDNPDLRRQLLAAWRRGWGWANHFGPPQADFPVWTWASEIDAQVYAGDCYESRTAPRPRDVPWPAALATRR